MEVVLIKAAQIILILSIIVVLHEGGHYAAARWFNTKVERFFLFFDVKFALWKTKIGETVYGIGWLPLGGYVKIAGMIDESMDTEQMKQPAQPWEFRSKPAWQRLIIMLAGIIVNLLLAMLIFSVLSFTKGESYVDVNKLENGIAIDSAQRDLGLLPGDVPVGVNGTRYDKLNDISKRTLIDGGELNVRRDGQIVNLPITEDDLVNILESRGSFFMPALAAKLDTVFDVAAASGLRKGDEIRAINGQPINGWVEVPPMIQNNVGNTLSFDVFDGEQMRNVNVQVPESGRLGMGPDLNMEKYLGHKDFGLFASINRGVQMTFATITDQIQGIGMLWSLKGKASKYVAGPIGIAKQLPATWDWTFFWSFTALLSAWLAFVNLLPIPGLDGGHAMFTLYEIITGRKPGDKFMEVMQIVGVVFLMLLMLLIFGNDIINLIYN
ncbi:MAG: RIP metalloprotease RseP [Weeksellaceae bacterium]|nr:RIP metalloprotease RseP [Weeksellaceae bacterium]